jgi:hypothetical protein
MRAAAARRALSSAGAAAPAAPAAAGEMLARLRRVPPALQPHDGGAPPPLERVQGALATVAAALAATATAERAALAPAVASAVCDAAQAALQASARACAPAAHAAHAAALLPALLPFILDACGSPPAAAAAAAAAHGAAWSPAWDAPDDLASFCVPPRLMSNVLVALLPALPPAAAAAGGGGRAAVAAAGSGGRAAVSSPDWLLPAQQRVPSLLEALAASGAHDLRVYAALLAHGCAVAAERPPPGGAGDAAESARAGMRLVARMLRATLSIAPAARAAAVHPPAHDDGGGGDSGGGDAGSADAAAPAGAGRAPVAHHHARRVGDPQLASGATHQPPPSSMPMKPARVLGACAPEIEAAVEQLQQLARVAAPQHMAAIARELQRQDAPVGSPELHRQLLHAAIVGAKEGDVSELVRLVDEHLGVAAGKLRPPPSAAASYSHPSRPRQHEGFEQHGPRRLLPGGVLTGPDGHALPASPICAATARDVLLVSTWLRALGKNSAGSSRSESRLLLPLLGGTTAPAAAPAPPPRRPPPVQIAPGLRYLAMHVHYGDAERRRREAAALAAGDLPAAAPPPVADPASAAAPAAAAAAGGAAAATPLPALLQLAVMRALLRVCARLGVPAPTLHFAVSTGALFDAAWPEARVAVCFGPAAMPPLAVQAAVVEAAVSDAKPLLAGLLRRGGRPSPCEIMAAAGGRGAVGPSGGGRGGGGGIRGGGLGDDDDVRAQSEDAGVLRNAGQLHKEEEGEEAEGAHRAPPPLLPLRDGGGGDHSDELSGAPAVAAQSLWVQGARALEAVARAVAAAASARQPFVHTTADPHALRQAMLAFPALAPASVQRQVDPARQPPVPTPVAGYHALLTMAAHQAGFNVFYVWRHELLGLRGRLLGAAGLPWDAPAPLLPLAALAAAEADPRFVLAVESLVLRKLAKLQAVLAPVAPRRTARA